MHIHFYQQITFLKQLRGIYVKSLFPSAGRIIRNGRADYITESGGQAPRGV